MVGLVFGETLQLTPAQWLMVVFNAAAWLWCYRMCGPEARPAGFSKTRPVSLTILLTLSGLWITFFDTYTCLDQRLLFEQARYLSWFEWPAFLEEFVRRPYVEFQPPFLTFWYSRTPVFWQHQLALFPFGLLCARLLWNLYGRNAALVMAAPVFALMIHQPSTDTVLFGLLLIVLRLCQLSAKGVQRGRCARHSGVAGSKASAVFFRSFASAQKEFCTPGQSFALMQRRRGVLSGILSLSKGLSKGCTPLVILAAICYSLTWMVKPLTLLTVPFIVPQLGIAGLSSLGVWGGYIWWSQRYAFGRHQWRFVLQQVLIGRLRPATVGTAAPSGSARQAMRAVLIKILRSFHWRWKHLGQHAVLACPFYLFPAYLRPWLWKGMLLAVIILVGYGNMKYFLLDLLFLFPVQQKE